MASSPDVIVRPAADADAAAFHRCLDSVARERNWLAMTAAPPLAVVAEFHRQLRASGGIDLLAVTTNGEVVGWLDIDRRPWEGMRHVGSLGMGVRQEARGRGIGRALVAAGLDAATESGITRVELEVFASNAPAIRLYEAAGFRHEGRKVAARRLDGQTEDLLVMARLAEAAT
jgi:RimJ/RimL family protein N-acetyltransferase